MFWSLADENNKWNGAPLGDIEYFCKLQALVIEWPGLQCARGISLVMFSFAYIGCVRVLAVINFTFAPLQPFILARVPILCFLFIAVSVSATTRIVYTFLSYLINCLLASQITRISDFVNTIERNESKMSYSRRRQSKRRVMGREREHRIWRWKSLRKSKRDSEREIEGERGRASEKERERE